MGALTERGPQGKRDRGGDTEGRDRDRKRDIDRQGERKSEGREGGWGKETERGREGRETFNLHYTVLFTPPMKQLTLIDNTLNVNVNEHIVDIVVRRWGRTRQGVTRTLRFSRDEGGVPLPDTLSSCGQTTAKLP